MHIRTGKRTSTRTRKKLPDAVVMEQLILRTLQDVVRGKSQKGQRPITAREQIMAGKVLASLKQLNLKREALQLRRELIHGRASEVSLAELVAEAEQRAEQRRHERETKATK